MANPSVKTIIDLTIFKEARPDMAIFSDESIQSSINSSSTLLDGKCYGLIYKVWVYYLSSNTDPNDPLYRTDWEIDQIKEAFIVQTQYQLNIGNDWSQGSENFSIGGLSSSFQRPIDRDVLAMGVANLLQNARVFKLQDMFNSVEELEEDCPWGTNSNSMFSPINRTIGDKRYVQQWQGGWPIGNVLSVGPNHVIQSSNPEDISWKNTTADLIKDWKFNDYKPINQITDLAFFGINMDDAMTRQEIVDAIRLREKDWKSTTTYNIGDVIYYAFEETGIWYYRTYLSLTQNINKQPNMNPLDWQVIIDIDVNMAEIVIEATANTIANFNPLFDDFKEEVKTVLIPEEVNSEVEKQLNELPTIENVVFAEGTNTLFVDEIQFTNTKLKYGILESDYTISYNVGDFVRHGTDGTEQDLKLNDIEFNIDSSNLPNIKYWLNAGIFINGSITNMPVAWASNVETGIVPPLFFINYQSAPFTYNQEMYVFLNDGAQVPLSQIGQTIKAKSSFIVTWLKDIVQKGIIRGGISEVKWGDIIGDIANQTDLNNILTIQTQDINQAQEDINNLYTLISNNPSLLETPLSQATPAPNLTFTFPTALIPNEYDYVAFMWNFINWGNGLFANQNVITIPKALDGTIFTVNIQGTDYEATCTPTTLSIAGAPSPQFGVWAIRNLYRAIPLEIANLIFLKGDDKCTILKEAFKTNSTVLKRYAFKSAEGYTYYFSDIEYETTIENGVVVEPTQFKWVSVSETYYGRTNSIKVMLATPINYESTIDFMMNSVVPRLRLPQFAMKTGQIYTGMLMSEWEATVRDVANPYVWWNANGNDRYITINLMRKVGATYQVQLDGNANHDVGASSHVGRLLTRTITTTTTITDTTTLANVIQEITDIAYADETKIINQNDIGTTKQIAKMVTNIDTTESVFEGATYKTQPLYIRTWDRLITAQPLLDGVDFIFQFSFVRKRNSDNARFFFASSGNNGTAPTEGSGVDVVFFPNNQLYLGLNPLTGFELAVEDLVVIYAKV